MSKVSTLSVEAAMNAYKGKSLNELTKAASDITKQDSDNSIMRRVQSICFYVGVACKAKGLDETATNAAVKGAYDEFRKGWYYKGAGGKREPLQASSVTAMTSALQNYGRAGLLPYNAAPFVAQIMHLEAMPLTQRGGKVAKLVEKHGDAAPKPKEFSVIVKGSGKPRNAAGRKPTSLLATWCTRQEEFAEEAKVVAFAKSNAVVGAHLRNIWSSVAMIAKALQADSGVSDETKKAVKSSQTTLAKVAASIPHKSLN
jgi:hypothetical protein